MDRFFELEAAEDAVEKSLRESVSQESLDEIPRHPAKKDYKYACWFITYPRCPLDKHLVLKYLEEKCKIKEYLIAQEFHKDGTPHIHCLLTLQDRIRWKKDMFDLKDLDKVYHGCYEVPISVPKSRDYLTKEDKDPLCNYNLKAVKSKQAKKIGIAELEMDPLDALEKGVISGLQLCNFIKNQNTYKYLKNKKKRSQKKINLDIEKKRHFWYYGDSNSGKTYNLKKMIMENPSDWFQIPTNNDWIGYNGEKNLYLDEYKGQLTIQELDRICDGGAKVNVKGGSAVLDDECVVYIVSNFNIKECYGKACKEKPKLIDALYNRFTEKLCSCNGGKYEII